MLAPSSETSDGVGKIRPLGSCCRRFGRDPCSVSREASLLNFLAVGILEANPRVSATSPGMVILHPPRDWVSASLRGLGLHKPPRIELSHPLSPCTHVRFGCKPGFSARRWCTYIYFPIFAQSTTLRFCRPAAVQPPSSSSL